MSTPLLSVADDCSILFCEWACSHDREPAALLSSLLQAWFQARRWFIPMPVTPPYPSCVVPYLLSRHPSPLSFPTAPHALIFPLYPYVHLAVVSSWGVGRKRAGTDLIIPPRRRPPSWPLLSMKDRRASRTSSVRQTHI